MPVAINRAIGDRQPARLPEAGPEGAGGGSSPPVTRGGKRSSTPGKPSLAVLFATVFLDLVGFGIVIPLLPLYAERFGAGPVTIAWLVAVYSLMQFVFAPWWGQLSDRIGRRPVLLVGLFGSAASYLLFGLAGSLTTLFIARLLAGIAGANVGVAQAYVADITAPEDRARGMGMIGAAFGLGFILGPAIGGFLAPFGAGVPFLAAGLLALINGLLAVRWLPESRDPAHAPVEGTASIKARWHSLRRFARIPGTLSLFTALFLLTLAFAALEATISLFADRQWSFTPSGVAFLFVYLGVIVTIVQGGLVGILARRMGDKRVAILGMSALATGMAGMAVAPTLPFLALALALLAFGQGAATPALSALISRAAAPEERGRILGVSQSLSALGRVLGPLWGGLAFARIGISAPYLSGALVVMVGLLVLWFGATRRLEPE